ncbi:DUF3661 family vacuolar membrane protein [Pseudohyphozyma bogoriensis]|nr:DUF3661 family vacuolar membrane protein [Pseudohyphozyma bogoriensis]
MESKDLEGVGSLVGSLVNSTLPLLALPQEDVDPETCALLGPLALIVQGVMGVLVLGSLLLKRAREKPRRKWRVWIGDVSKQVTGQAFVHGANVAISDVLNIGIDTTLGVLILYGFLKLSAHYLQIYFPTSFRTGDYGNPFSMAIWGKQAAVYVACLAMMKVVVLLLLWAFPWLVTAVNWCLKWLDSDEVQVVFAMLIFPLMMNVFQFLVIDSILRSKSTDSPLLDGTDDEEARRGFLENQDSDPDDEDSTPSTPITTSKVDPPKYSGLEPRVGGAGARQEDDDGDEPAGWGSGGTTPRASGTPVKEAAHSYPPTTPTSSERAAKALSESKSSPAQPVVARTLSYKKERTLANASIDSFDAWGLDDDGEHASRVSHESETSPVNPVEARTPSYSKERTPGNASIDSFDAWGLEDDIDYDDGDVEVQVSEKSEPPLGIPVGGGDEVRRTNIIIAP